MTPNSSNRNLLAHDLTTETSATQNTPTQRPTRHHHTGTTREWGDFAARPFVATKLNRHTDGCETQ